MDLKKPTSTISGKTTMRTESAGVGYGLSDRMGFNATAAGDGPMNTSGANGFHRDQKASQSKKSVSEKGQTFTIDGA